MNISKLWRFDLRLSAAMLLVFLPWLVVVFLTAGGWGALNYLVYAMVVFAAGYGIVRVALPVLARSEMIVLAPATGILAISAVSAFWLRFGLPLIWTPALWLALAAWGAACFWRDRANWERSTIAHGFALACLSALICAVYFVPGARTDAVKQPDGSFNWMYVDTQHFQAIAASIKNGPSPPRSPGTATAELLYHFGPYTPAAAISKLDGLNLGDAVARVTRAAALWALVLSCFGLGTFLSLKATGRRFGGIAAVAALFFYGALLALLAFVDPSHSRLAGTTLFRIITESAPLSEGGAFSHLILGHSTVHALGAITVIMALCLAAAEGKSEHIWRRFLLLMMPALVVPVNSLAAIYCLGITCILLFWTRLKEKRAWLGIILAFCTFAAAWKIMGYAHAPDAAHAMIRQQMTEQWWTLTEWFLVGLGFRVLGLRWISRPLKDPTSAMVLASVIGMLAFSVVIQLRDGNERYGIQFLQCILSILAFSRASLDWWRASERGETAKKWLGLATGGMVFFTVSGFMIAGVAAVTRQHTGITHFGIKLFLSFIALLILAASSALMNRNRWFLRAGSAVLMGVLLVGFLAWVPKWVHFGLGWARSSEEMNITLAPGEVRGLERLKQLAAPTERFATNKHGFDELPEPREHSYAYTALSERPVLLEGYLNRGEYLLPWFDALHYDNDLLFSTADAGILRDTARKWQVRWVVARPGTDISLPRPLPGWLVEQQDCGDLKIYRVD